MSDLPPAVVQMVHDACGTDADLTLAGYATERTPAFRANTLKARPGEITKALDAAGIPYARHRLSDWSFTTTPEGERLLKASEPYRQGHVYSQSLPSQLPALLGTVRGRVLDCCAAPGGKTGILAMRLGDGGAGLVACERAAVRFQLLQHNLKLLGCTRVQTRQIDTRTLEAKPFDHILLDPPCTGSGTIRLAHPHSHAVLAEDYEGYVTTRSFIQKGLAERAVSLLKPGGTLVYSTCSIDPRENEAVVEHLLSLRVRLELKDLATWHGRLERTRPGLAAFRDRAFRPELARCLRVLPGPEGEGFFVALLKRGA
jgi:16S rRNA C967 or C1407 C5-methylase (RsmB/RsmF family)